MKDIDYKKLVQDIKGEIGYRVYMMEHGDSFTQEDFDNDVRMEALRGILKFIDERIESMKEKAYIGYNWRFKTGDRLYSTNNPRLTYTVLEDGVLNENGEVEYKVEIFLDGKPGLHDDVVDNDRNIQFIECRKMDKWAEYL